MTELLTEILPQNIKLVDSSAAIARQVEAIMKSNAPEKLALARNINDTSNQSVNECYMTFLEKGESLTRGLEKFNFRPPKLYQLT